MSLAGASISAAVPSGNVTAWNVYFVLLASATPGTRSTESRVGAASERFIVNASLRGRGRGGI